MIQPESPMLEIGTPGSMWRRRIVTSIRSLALTGRVRRAIRPGGGGE
jgi:hypothetical protein